MSTLIPSITSCKDVTPGERRFARLLEAKLEDDYLCWCNVPLSESPTPRQYWGKVKRREFTDFQLSPVWVQLKLEADDGKKYATDCANTKGLFRIIQAIPSPNKRVRLDFRTFEYPIQQQ